MTVLIDRPAKLDFAHVLAQLQVAAALWRRRARSRTELARLSERELKDLGIGPSAALYESRKPFWRE